MNTAWKVTVLAFNTNGALFGKTIPMDHAAAVARAKQLVEDRIVFRAEIAFLATGGAA